MLQKCLQSEKNVVRYKIRKVIIGGIGNCETHGARSQS